MEVPDIGLISGTSTNPFKNNASELRRLYGIEIPEDTTDAQPKDGRTGGTPAPLRRREFAVLVKQKGGSAPEWAHPKGARTGMPFEWVMVCGEPSAEQEDWFQREIWTRIVPDGPIWRSA